MTQHMLTTVDNPHDPFTQFNEWYAWDRKAGYDTLGLLDRIIRTSDELSDAEQDDAYEAAIQEIVDENVLGVHVLVTEGATPRVRLSA